VRIPGVVSVPAVAALLALLVTACEVPPPESASGEDPVLAEIDGTPIRRSDVTERLASLPRLSHGEYGGDLGRARLLKQMVEEEMLFRAAVDAGLEDDPEIRRTLENQRRGVLVQAYLDRRREESTRVSDEEIRDYYEAHRDEYATEKMLRVRLLSNPDSTIVARGRAIADEEALRFDEVCARFNPPGPLKEARGMLPSWVRRDRAVTWLGNHPGFHEVAFATGPGELSPVFRTPKGWHVLKVEEVREARQRPLEEVRKDIEGRLARERAVIELPALLDELRERYRVVELEPPGRSPSELFAAAQAAPNARERVALYEELLERYPDHERAIESRFMLGFLLAEELGDREAAAEQFRRLVAEHPDSELAQSARWMLSSESQSAPALQTEEAPGTDPQEATP
jgi:peptidyl-prolyl cis-trans isomerase C